MKVIHRSDRLLVLEDRPWFLGIFMISMTLMFVAGSMAVIGEGQVLGGALLGLVGGGIPILIAALMVRRVRLALDRGDRTVTRTSRSVRGLTQETYALDRLEKAQLAVSTDSDGTTYRTELRLTAPPETVPFTSYYTNGRKPQQMVDAVNDWLATQTDVRRPESA